MSPRLAVKKNTPGRISLIIGGVIMLVGAVSLVVQTLILTSNSSALMSVFGPISAFTQIVLALTGLTFGVIGATRHGPPKLAAGVGLGIAASLLLSMLMSFVASAIFSAL